MSVERPLGEGLFTLVMKQVPWNEVLQSSQEMLQCIYLCLSSTPFRLLSEPGNWRPRQTHLSHSRDHLLPHWVYSSGANYNWLFLCSKQSHSQQHLLEKLFRTGPQNKALHLYSCDFTPLTPLTFSGSSELTPWLTATSLYREHQHPVGLITRNSRQTVEAKAPFLFRELLA